MSWDDIGTIRRLAETDRIMKKLGSKKA